MDSSDKRLYIIIGVVVLILAPVGFYFASQWQKDFNAKAAEESKNSDGGQIGHIGALYDTLERTDPVNHESTPMGATPDFDEEDMKEVFRAARQGQAPEPAPEPRKQLPIIEPVWTSDLAAAELPASQVNGTVSGTNFLSDITRLGQNGSTYVLTFRKGTNAVADAEVMVVLRMKPGASIETNTWEIAKNTRSAPQIVKKWKTSARLFAQKTYSTGYVMKLEFGQDTGGVLPGKIYLALPDKEQSVIAGEFAAETPMAARREVWSTYTE